MSGDAFGAPNCFRISYAASEEIITTSFKDILVQSLRWNNKFYVISKNLEIKEKEYTLFFKEFRYSFVPLILKFATGIIITLMESMGL